MGIKLCVYFCKGKKDRGGAEEGLMVGVNFLYFRVSFSFHGLFWESSSSSVPLDWIFLP